MQYEGLNRVLEDFGSRVVKDLRDNIDSKKLNATHVLWQSVDYKVWNDGANTHFWLGWLGDADDYAYYADKGRSAGKNPPIEAIEEWITEKGIDVSEIGKNRPKKKRGKINSKLVKRVKGAKIKRVIKRKGTLSQRRSLAYLIARKIGQKGTSATNFYSEIVNDKLFADLRRDLADAFKKDINVEIYKK